MGKKVILLLFAVCLIVANAFAPDVDYDDPGMVAIRRKGPGKLNLCRQRPNMPFCRELRKELRLSDEDIAKPRKKRVLPFWMAFCWSRCHCPICFECTETSFLQSAPKGCGW